MKALERAEGCPDCRVVRSGGVHITPCAQHMTVDLPTLNDVRRRDEKKRRPAGQEGLDAFE